MATQNFLSGGYYGKLGDTVGQRWHNKRIIRTYVIPHNPRTEAEQANRRLFARATRLAQVAFKANKGSPLWDTSQMGQFSILVQVALRHLKAGMSDAEAIPLYPDGYDPAIVLSNASTDWSSWPSSVTVAAESHVMTHTRMFRITVSCKDEHTGNIVSLSYDKSITPGSYVSYVFVQAMRYSLPAGSHISAVTIDDAQRGGSSISLPTVQLLQPSLPWVTITITWSSHYYNTATKMMYIYAYNVPQMQDTDDIFNLLYYNNEDDDWDNTDIHATWSPPGALTIAILSDDITQFPSGCQIEEGGNAQEEETCWMELCWNEYEFSW